MRAILITGGPIREVNFTGTLQNIYDHLHCKTFSTAGYLPNGDCAYVDEDILATFDWETMLHKVKWYPQPIIGNILIVGSTPMGDSAPSRSSVQDVKSLLEWSMPAGNYKMHIFKRLA